MPFIFVSGTIGEEYAIRALKNGATDYGLKINLIRLPIDAVKIDRGFVHNLGAKREDASIVAAILSLAHPQLLARLKCDEMQGYLISKPLPAADVEALL